MDSGAVGRIEATMDLICATLQAHSEVINSVADHLARAGDRSSLMKSTAARDTDAAASDPGSGEQSELPPPADTWAGMKLAVLQAHGAAQSAQVKQPQRDLDESTRGLDSVESMAALGNINEVAPDTNLENVLARIPALTTASELRDDQLRNAVADRDQVIRLLIAQLRQPARTTLSTEQLRHISESAPDVLQQRIEQTLLCLDRQVRLGELELSLERARMARQVTTLQATRQKLQQAARSFGMTLNEDGTLDGEMQTPATGSRGRRWLGVLGFGN